MRLKFSGSNQRSYGGSTLPAMEPNGTSTANPTLFPNPLHTNGLHRFVRAASSAWVVTPKFFVNTNVGYFAYDIVPGHRHAVLQRAAARVRRFEHVHGRGRHRAAARSRRFPPSLQQLNGYADKPASTRNVRDKFGRVGVNVDGTYYASFKGQHTLKAGVQWERLSNDVLTGAQAPTVALNWNASRTTLDDPPRQVRGTYGYYTVSRTYTEGKIHSNNVGFFLQDAWTINNRLTLNLGLRVRRRDDSVLSARESEPRVRHRRQDRAARRLRLRHQGRRPVEGLRQLGPLLRHLASSRCRAARGVRITGSTTTTRSIRSTGRRSTARGRRAPAAPARSSSRPIAGTSRTMPNNNLIDPNLKPIRTQEFTLGVDHELTRSMSVGVRYAHKWLDRTIEDVGIQVAGVGEVFMIANPGYRHRRVHAGRAAARRARRSRERKRVYDGLEFRLRKRLSNNWSMNTSYTYSHLVGNYSGLTSSDENGPQLSPSVARFFDGLYMSFDAHGNPIDGELQTDRPHYFKLQDDLRPAVGHRRRRQLSRRRAARCSRARSPTRACRYSTTPAAIWGARRSTARRISSRSRTSA